MSVSLVLNKLKFFPHARFVHFNKSVFEFSATALIWMGHAAMNDANNVSNPFYGEI